MSSNSKRQTTMAKRAREQVVRERRALKLEKRQAAALARRAAAEGQTGTPDKGGSQQWATS